MTEQEAFWAGDFGHAYIQRNQAALYLPANLAFFSRVLSKTHAVNDVLELGANIGANLMAIKQLRPDIQLSAVEINQQAYTQLMQLQIDARHQSILSFKPEKKWDLVLIKGVLIHISPDNLAEVYDVMYQSSERYICIAEYYSPTPVEVPYRGHRNKLFKRDFAGEMMDKYPDLRLVDYGFYYHRDPVFPMDDMNWFLLEKRD
ncbi:MAG: pseudaminic acid biosynthesis-associated methylase [Candidatus Sericytochromatia bacterium]|nr:pseudaminic acid biosynthesis-associated methylase [Candidatus Sericytochromatia bacterium]